MGESPNVPTGFPTMGGEFANPGPDKGNYRVIVAEASWSEAKTGTPMLLIKLQGKDDPNHPAKEGKNVATMRQCWPKAGADHDSVLRSKGIIKRMVFDGFGVPWPKDEKPIDPRQFYGKTAWVQIGDTKNQDGSTGTGVVAVSQTLEKLPAPRVKLTGAPTAAKSSTAAAGATSSRRRGARTAA